MLAASEARFFERLSGFALAFARNARGKVTRLTLRAGGRTFAYEKFTEQAPEEIKPPVAVKLDPKLYDACVGRYEFGPDDLFPDGITLTLRRQGDGLTGEASNRNGSLGAADNYAETETNFFVTIGVHLIFNQNDKHEVTSVIPLARLARLHGEESGPVNGLAISRRRYPTF